MEDIGKLFGVSPRIINGIIGILSLDFEAFGKMIAPIAHIDVKTITKIMRYVDDLIRALQEHSRRNKALKRKEKKIVQKDEFKDTLDKIEQGKASTDDLFKVVNAQGDKKGGISK